MPIIWEMKCVVHQEVPTLQSSHTTVGKASPHPQSQVQGWHVRQVGLSWCRRSRTEVHSSTFRFAQNFSPKFTVKLIRAWVLNMLSQNGQVRKEKHRQGLSAAWLCSTVNSGQRAHISQRHCYTAAMICDFGCSWSLSGNEVKACWGMNWDTGVDSSECCPNTLRQGWQVGFITLKGLHINLRTLIREYNSKWIFWEIIS